MHEQQEGWRADEQNHGHKRRVIDCFPIFRKQFTTIKNKFQINATLPAKQETQTEQICCFYVNKTPPPSVYSSFEFLFVVALMVQFVLLNSSVSFL